MVEPITTPEFYRSADAWRKTSDRMNDPQRASRTFGWSASRPSRRGFDPVVGLRRCREIVFQHLSAGQRECAHRKPRRPTHHFAKSCLVGQGRTSGLDQGFAMRIYPRRFGTLTAPVSSVLPQPQQLSQPTLEHLFAGRPAAAGEPILKLTNPHLVLRFEPPYGDDQPGGLARSDVATHF